MHLDLKQKYQIAQRIEALIVVENGQRRYADGWTDTRLAREFRVTPAQVRGVRTQLFADLIAPRGGGTGRTYQTKGLIQELRDEVTSLRSDVNTLKSLLNIAA
jgi:hypothetical protein